jgi:osmotically-inducible protein OsmY
MDTITDLKVRVEAALAKDPRTQNISFEVINENGLITLKGQVEEPALRQAALHIASQQDGVIDVIDEIGLTLETEVEIPENLKFVKNNPTNSN